MRLSVHEQTNHALQDFLSWYFAMSFVDPFISVEVPVEAGVDEVWRAWTTETGVESFFAPRCNIKLRVGGAYEMLFDLEAAPGLQGGEGMIITAMQPEKMLSFTWNAPPHLPDVRGQMTHVVVRFLPIGANQTLVRLTHTGWGEGGQWEEAFNYFQRAWSAVVLPRLQARFVNGPVDWER